LLSDLSGLTVVTTDFDAGRTPLHWSRHHLLTYLIYLAASYCHGVAVVKKTLPSLNLQQQQYNNNNSNNNNNNNNNNIQQD